MTLQKNHLFLAVILLFISCKHADPEDCRKIRTGNFILHDRKHGIEFQISRNDSLQKEVETLSGQSSFWKVKWSNDCTYTLTLLNDTYGMMQSGKQPPEVSFEIIDVKKDYYIFRQEFELLKNGLIDTCWIQH